MVKYLCITMLLVQYAFAKDFGVIGKTWDICERDPVQEIQAKLKLLDIKYHNELIKQKMEDNIKNPISLNLPKAKKNNIFYYDPTIAVEKDLKDAYGRVFHKAGTKVNPFDYVYLHDNWLFFDAEDKEQLEYALKTDAKFILTGGSPIELEQKYGLNVYFDQYGLITKQLSIKSVPAMVSQDNKLLRIEEIAQ